MMKLSFRTIALAGGFTALAAGLGAVSAIQASAAPSPAAPAPVAQPTAQTAYFADNGFGNAVAVVQQPAGEYRDGVTYVAYQGPQEDPYVAAYDHRSATWLGPVRAAISPLGKDPARARKIDNHGKPTMIIDDAGYIHVFFGGHGGRPEQGKNPLGDTHDGANSHVVSKRPLDISAWETLDNIPTFGTYNQAVKMDNGDIYLFYRHGAHRSDWVYQKSTDNGRSFAAPVSFLKHKRRTDLTATDSWYAFVQRGKGNEIIVGFDYHLCWDGKSARDARGHTTERHDAFYMTMDTDTGLWRNVQGEKLPMPLVREVAEQKALVARTGDLWTFNGSVRLDPQGLPHVATTAGEDIGQKTGGPKQMRHYRWTGTQWVGGHSTALPIANGDFIAESPQTIRFLLESRDQGNQGVVGWWQSQDGGDSFVKGKELLRIPGAGFAISAMIRNAHPDARVIVAATERGSDMRKMYLLGDRGPMGRAVSAAKSSGQ